MVELCHAHSKALHHCMHDIIHTVIFTDVALKLYGKDIITLNEYERLPRLDNREAIEQVVNNIIYSSDSDYIKFLEVLTRTEKPQYTELRDKITAEYERLQGESEIDLVRTPPVVHTPLSMSTSSCTGDRDTFTSATESTTSTVFEPIAIISRFTQKTIIGKTFTEFLIYLCKLFLKAINNGAVHLAKNAEEHRQYITNEVSGSITILNGIKEKFSNVNNNEQEDDLVQYALMPILVVRASRIVDVIRQPFWEWPANNMDTLLSLCDGMVKVVKGTRDIDNTSFCQLIAHIQQLSACLDNTDAMLQKMFNSQIVLTFTLGAGAAICFILGVALTCTPAAAATVPLMVAGGVLTWQTLVQTGLIVKEVINAPE